MATTDYTRDALDAASRLIGEDGPIRMVNMLRYRPVADYGGDVGREPCSGRDAYTQAYVPAFNRLARGEKVSVFWIGRVRALVVPLGDDAWDDIVIVEYENFAALRRILENPAYEAEAAPHRRAALEAWRFIATNSADLPR